MNLKWDVRRLVSMKRVIAAFCDGVLIAKIDDACNITNIVEKPTKPPSKYAVTGLYILDKTAPNKARKLTKSHRGELEIVDVLNLYLRDKQLAH